MPDAVPNDDPDRQQNLPQHQEDQAASKRSVSFNRDVHVKRIAPNRAPAPAPPAVDNIRRQRLGLNSKELAEEAAKVLAQASSVKCSSSPTPEKYFSLPNRRRHKSNPTPRRKSEELGVTTDLPPAKGTRTSLSRSSSDAAAKKPKSNGNGNSANNNTLLNLFKRPDKDLSYSSHEPISKKDSAPVKRSKSDVSDLKSSGLRQVRKRTGSESEEYLNSVAGKKSQLSPIIEVNQSEDYFKPKNTKVEYKVNPIEKPPRTKEPRPPARPKRAKTQQQQPLTVRSAVRHFDTLRNEKRPFVIDALDRVKGAKGAMIHSSQKPVEKLPLTKGQTVDNIVKILNQDKYAPPPKASLIVPPSTAAHNNNQPFSYTKPISVSPDPNMYARSPSPERPPSPINRMNLNEPSNRGIIYAQVVCGDESKNRRQHSDEDEGLGYEDHHHRLSGHYRSDHNGDFSYDAHRDSDEHIDVTDSPITPRFKDYRSRKFSEDDLVTYENQHEHQRGRGDGMDSRRRESVNEQQVVDTKYDSKIAELSYRRELLENRFNARRKRDQISPVHIVNQRFSPEKEIDDLRHNSPIRSSPRNHESKVFSRSDSPVDKALTIDRRQFIDRRLAEEPPETSKYFNQRTSRYFPPEPEYEPPSLDASTSSKYSPENRKYKKSSRGYMSSQEGLNSKYVNNSSSKYRQEKSIKERYASNPEISQKHYDPMRPETFHNSLQRPRNDFHGESTSRGRGASYANDNDRDRDNKFADSGIENDYRKDSNGDIPTARVVVPPPTRGAAAASSAASSRYKGVEPKNESEDEGFASSLLITSERHGHHHHHQQHVEESSKKVKSELKRSPPRRDEFIHRERSIDDGSFYDPRLDKFEERPSSRQLSSKPPKATKKMSGLEKVKQLFSRDSSKKSKKEKEIGKDGYRLKDKERAMVKEEDLRRRYTEYRGSSENLDTLEPRRGRISRSSDLEIDSRISSRNERSSRIRDEGDSSIMDYNYSQRRRLATPSPSPSPPRRTSEKTDTTSRRLTTTPGGWFKSLDRLSRNKSKNIKADKDSTEDESTVAPKSGKHSKPTSKNLRFFGDTDLESNDSVSKHNSILRKRTNLLQNGKAFSNSVGSLDRRDTAAESRHKSSSYGNLNATSSDSRRNLLANSYNKEKFGALHNISEIHSNSETESQFEERERRFNSDTDHRYELNKERKPPMSPLRDRRRSRSQGGNKVTKSAAPLPPNRTNLSGSRNDISGSRQDVNGNRTRRKRVQAGATSPGDSSTEGDSSHQSQRSIVYLHAATVGDIPTTGRISRGRSRDDVSSVNSNLRPHVKTVSRSFSVLAPWKPRHYRESYDINYSQSGHEANSSTLRRTDKSKSSSTRNLSRTSSEAKTNTSTLSRRTTTEEDSKATSTLLRRNNRSKENLDGHQLGGGARNYKKSMSTEVLSRDSPPKTVSSNRRTATIERERLSRSISMPKDPNKSAGWFKITKKSKKSDSGSRVY